MKTITSKLAALLLFFMGAIAANAETKVYLDDINIAAGEEAVVGVNLDNADDPNIIGVLLNITLPEGLEIVLNEDGDIFTKTERLGKYHNLNGTYRSDLGVYRLSISSMSRVTIKETSGAIATFTVKANDKIANSTMKVSDISLTKKADGYPDIYPADSEATVSVADRLDGDVMFYVGQDEYNVNPGDEFTVVVNISNTATLASMQCYITIPEGLELVENADGLLFDLTEELAEVFGMSIGDDLAAEGKYFFALSSYFNEPLPDEGVLFTFNLKATENLPETAEILIDKFLVANKAAKGFNLDNQIKVTVSNAVATGIDAAKASVAGAEYFTVGGQRVAAPQKGINVVKMANGEVKKIRF